MSYIYEKLFFFFFFKKAVEKIQNNSRILARLNAKTLLNIFFLFSLFPEWPTKGHYYSCVFSTWITLHKKFCCDSFELQKMWQYYNKITTSCVLKLSSTLLSLLPLILLSLIHSTNSFYFLGQFWKIFDTLYIIMT